MLAEDFEASWPERRKDMIAISDSVENHPPETS
jgi:hypothetical protein